MNDSNPRKDFAVLSVAELDRAIAKLEAQLNISRICGKRDARRPILKAVEKAEGEREL